MSLVADYSDSSTSSSDSASDDEQKEAAQNPESSKPILPSANVLLKNAGSTSASEVFQTKYHREEQASKASLERHVKMVENDEHMTTKNGRKICWNYRKGRCRFGTKCQYAHDSDLSTENAKQQVDDNKQKPTTTMQQTSDEPIAADEKKQSTKRKRPVLGDSVTPGKRAMKAYKQTHK